MKKQNEKNFYEDVITYFKSKGITIKFLNSRPILIPNVNKKTKNYFIEKSWPDLLLIKSGSLLFLELKMSDDFELDKSQINMFERLNRNKFTIKILTPKIFKYLKLNFEKKNKENCTKITNLQTKDEIRKLADYGLDWKN